MQAFRKQSSFSASYILSGENIVEICNRCSNITGRIYKFEKNKDELCKMLQDIHDSIITVEHIDLLLQGNPPSAVSILSNATKDVFNNIYDIASIEHILRDHVLIDVETINTLALHLSKVENSVTILVAPKGRGKTTLINMLEILTLIGSYPELKQYRFTDYNIDNSLVSLQTPHSQPLIDDKTIVIIDNNDYIFRSNTITSSLSNINNTIENILSHVRAYNAKLIISVTEETYKEHIMTSPISGTINTVTIPDISDDDLLYVLEKKSDKLHRMTNVRLDKNILKRITYIGNRYIPKRAEPARSIEIMYTAAAIAGNSRNNIYKMKDVLSEMSSLYNDYRVSEAIDNANEKCLKIINESIEEDKLKYINLSENHLRKAISIITDINIEHIADTPIEIVEQAEKYIRNGLFGQEESVTNIVKAISRSILGIQEPTKPIASFMFIGPTGVGKTETAKLLAKALYGDEKAIHYYDMSEYSMSHDVSKLLGTGAGFVGYNEGGKIVNDIIRKPNAVVLLDEIEKAHHTLQNVLLQLLDEGRLTDGKGVTGDFTRAVIIMTSNIGAIAHTNSVGFGDKEDKIQTKYSYITAAEKHFKPEFLNRLTRMIVFEPLSLDDAKKVATKHLDKLINRTLINNPNVIIEYTDEYIDYIIKDGYEKRYGGRSIVRFIDTTVADSIAENLLKSTNQKTTKIIL